MLLQCFGRQIVFVLGPCVFLLWSSRLPVLVAALVLFLKCGFVVKMLPIDVIGCSLRLGAHEGSCRLF